MRVVRPDDFTSRCARAPKRGEVIGRFHLEPRWAAPHVPRSDGVLHDLLGPDEESAALVRPLFHRMRYDLIEDRLTDLHA